MAIMEIGFQNRLTQTAALVEEVKKMEVVDTQSHALAEAKRKSIRDIRKELEAEYKAHPAIIEAKRLQSFKCDLDKVLENTDKELKQKQFRFEEAEAAKRRAEEQRMAAEMKRKADEEAAILAEIERKKADAARAEAARARKRGDEEATRLAMEKQAAGKAEAERIKAEAAAAVMPEVVLPDTTPKAKSRAAWKFRLTGKTVPPAYTVPDEVKIGKMVRDSEGKVFAGQDWITCYPEKV